MSRKSHAKIAEDAVSKDQIEYLEQSLADLEVMAAKATTAKSYTAAANLKKAAISTRRELDAARAALAAAAPLPSDPDERREHILLATRQLRVAAQESGSYVAASQLIRLEAEILAAAPEVPDEYDDSEDPEAQLTSMIDALQGLPLDLRLRIARQLGE